MEQNTNELVIFETGDKSIVLPVAMKEETVWLSANQMSLLFERDEKTIRKHINTCEISKRCGISSLGK